MKAGPGMNRWFHRVAAVALGGFVLMAVMARAEPPGPSDLLRKMIAAIVSNDYEAFVAGGDPAFKAALTKPVFEGGTSRLVPRLTAGYSVSFLGTLNKGDFTIHLWKLSFKDGKDDLLARMDMKDGKILRFAFQ
jgi:hypothetical protein